ncbi:hypothetical protein HDU67_000551 [Dinochytrium kinnereticum]|nr:hypothetical protein HDU67_000551 [Dinochytrium kinnereticum]
MTWAVAGGDKKDEAPAKAPQQKQPSSWAAAAAGGTSGGADEKVKPKPVAAAAVVPQKQSCGSVPQPSGEELRSFAAAAERLWGLDSNRLTPGTHYKLDLQSGKKAFQEGDVARNPLFSFVDEKAIMAIPSYKAFYHLLDNFEKKSGVVECKGGDKDREISDFISALLATGPIQYAHAYLKAKNLAPASSKEFGELLKKLWFSNYKRLVHGDSSAFEHVFVGEVREDKVVGGHNWVQFWNEERAKRIDYQGYIFPRRRNGPRPEDHPHIITLQFTWDGYLKPLTTLFIGTSPEFEIALYTMAFYESKSASGTRGGEGDCNVQACLEDVEFEMKVHGFTDRQGDRIGSVYPVCQG